MKVHPSFPDGFWGRGNPAVSGRPTEFLGWLNATVGSGRCASDLGLVAIYSWTRKAFAKYKRAFPFN